MNYEKIANMLYKKMGIIRKSNVAKSSSRMLEFSSDVEDENVKAYFQNMYMFLQNKQKRLYGKDFLNTFRTNIKTLKFIYEYNPTTVSGKYSPFKNEMIIYLPLQENTLFHEILHMASSYKDDQGFNCGFSQQDTNGVITGKGLTEGYTETLTKRYNGTDIGAYEKLTDIAEIIENIVGEEEMTKLYFNSDLYGLLAILSKYTSKRNVGILIKSIDRYNELYSEKRKKLYQARKQKRVITEQCIQRFYSVKEEEMLGITTDILNEMIQNRLQMKEQSISESIDTMHLLDRILDSYDKKRYKKNENKLIRKIASKN